MALFGLPFFLAGCVVALIGVGAIPLENGSEVPFWGFVLMIVMGAVFIGVGGGLVFGRGVITIDASRGSVSQSWGFLAIPLRTREYALGEFTEIVIDHTPGDSDSSERFPVRLWSSVTALQIEVTSPTAFEDAYAHGLQLSRLTKRPLRDRTGDQEVLLPVDAQGGDLRGRLPLQGRSTAPVQRPAGMKTEVADSGGVRTFTIPGRGLRPSAALKIAAPLVIFFAILSQFYPFFDETGTPEPVQWFFFAFLALFLLIPLIGGLLSIVRAVRERTVVVAGAEGITVEERGAWRTRTMKIPAGAILSVTTRRVGAAPDGTARPGWVLFLARMVPSDGITVKSTVGVCTFGAGLPDEELQYLCAALVEALTHSQR